MEITREPLSKYDLLNLTRVNSSPNNKVYKLENGTFLKIIDMKELIRLAKKGFFLDRALEYSEEIKDTAIIIPSKSIFDDTTTLLGAKFNSMPTVGFVLPGAKGISLLEFIKELRRKENLDLNIIVSLYASIEKEVKRVNKLGGIFPDLLNITNIFIRYENNDFIVEFIDYDGIQLGDNPSTRDCSKMNINFYKRYKQDSGVYRNGLYTKKLDMVSLNYLFFYLLLQCNLDELNKPLGPNIYSFLIKHNIKDIFLINKVKQSVYPYFDADSIDYMGNEIYRFADNYKLVTVGKTSETYKRIIVRK